LGFSRYRKLTHSVAVSRAVALPALIVVVAVADVLLNQVAVSPVAATLPVDVAATGAAGCAAN